MRSGYISTPSFTARKLLYYIVASQRRSLVWLFAISAVLAAWKPSCFAASSQRIKCPAGRIYQDITENAGSETFCELLLPGFLAVKDGPYRSYFSEQHPGDEGIYSEGRRVGAWTECDRFGRCQQVFYDSVSASEKKRLAFKSELPVHYVNRDYRFDFGSCRSSLVSYVSGPVRANLNIKGDSPYRCEISYLAESGSAHDASTDYTCNIPFSVGVRDLKSIDLRTELLTSGLPRFCAAIRKKGNPLIIQDNKGLLVATLIDVQRATLARNAQGADVLTIKLSAYATNVFKNALLRAGPLTTLLCFHPLTEPLVVPGNGGTVSLSYKLATGSAMAREQRMCATESLLRPSTQGDPH